MKSIILSYSWLPTQKKNMVVVGSSHVFFSWFHFFQMLVQFDSQHDVRPGWYMKGWICNLKAEILPASVRKAPFHRAKATEVKPAAFFNSGVESADTLPPSQNVYKYCNIQNTNQYNILTPWCGFRIIWHTLKWKFRFLDFCVLYQKTTKKVGWRREIRAQHSWAVLPNTSMASFSGALLRARTERFRQRWTRDIWVNVSWGEDMSLDMKWRQILLYRQCL